MAKRFFYQININQFAEKTTYDGQEARKFKDIQLDFRFDGDEYCMQDGIMTGQGLKIVAMALTQSITNMARYAKQLGYSEGEIIKDSMDMLQQAFIDPRDRNIRGTYINPDEPKPKNGQNP